jgi:hypothetical protein
VEKSSERGTLAKAAATFSRRLLSRIAAVDHQLRSGDELCLVRRKVEHTISNVIGLPDVTDWMHAVQQLATLRDIALRFQVVLHIGVQI